MRNRSKTIRLSVDYEGEIYQIETYPNEYRSLMMLIYDKICPEDFGDCLGMGKCGTCLVEVTSDRVLGSYDRNEATTLRKAGAASGLRLACQMLIDERINGITIIVKRP